MRGLSGRVKVRIIDVLLLTQEVIFLELGKVDEDVDFIKGNYCGWSRG